MRVSCPPTRHPCYYGIDFPTRGELIASRRDVEGIRRFIGLDSLHYLSLEGMLSAMPLPAEHFCTACFSGKYPIKPCEDFRKGQFERGGVTGAERGPA